MSKPFRYDWLGSLERIQEAGEDPASFCFYCLPIAGAKLIVALLERAKWKASYRGYDYELTEEQWEGLMDIVETTEVELMANCDDLVASIVNQVTQNVIEQNIIQNTISDITCCMNGEDGSPPVIFPPDPTDTPAGFGTEAGQRCARSQKAHDGGKAFLIGVFDLTEGLGGLTAGALWLWLTTAVATGGAIVPITLPIVLIAAIVGYIVTLVADSLTDEAIADWDELKHPVACCFAWSETAEQAKGCINDAIDEADIGDTAKALFKAIYHQGRVNAIWDGEEGYDGEGYSPTYCNDCISGDPIALRFEITQYSTEATGGTNNGMGWVSEEDFPNDRIATTGRINKEDIEGLEPVVVVLRDSASPDVTLYPGYSASWQVRNHWNKDASDTTGFIGMQNASGSPKIASATLSGFQVLRYDGTVFTWQPVDIVQSTVLPEGMTISGGSIHWVEQEWAQYPADYLETGVRVWFQTE